MIFEDISNIFFPIIAVYHADKNGSKYHYKGPLAWYMWFYQIGEKLNLVVNLVNSADYATAPCQPGAFQMHSQTTVFQFVHF